VAHCGPRAQGSSSLPEHGERGHRLDAVPWGCAIRRTGGLRGVAEIDADCHFRSSAWTPTMVASSSTVAGPLLLRRGHHPHPGPTVRKNDSSTWTEKLVGGAPAGRLRPLRTGRAVSALNSVLYAAEDYVNFLQPRSQARQKTRDVRECSGGMTPPRTPYRRLLSLGNRRAATRRHLDTRYKAIHPVHLKRPREGPNPTFRRCHSVRFGDATNRSRSGSR